MYFCNQTVDMYKAVIRSLLFKFDPETVHYFTFDFIKLISKIPLVPSLLRGIFKVKHSDLQRELFGLKFENPVGLAAGFDKNAVLYNELANFGFGFIEIGTVTPKAQDGNPKKRLFRLKEDNGLINRMGFNNAGLEAVIKQLKRNKKTTYNWRKYWKKYSNFPRSIHGGLRNLLQGIASLCRLFCA